ncbi:MAG: ABC transporter transmembrane domain-containing protein, partial [Marmoricola sp.]
MRGEGGAAGTRAHPPTATRLMLRALRRARWPLVGFLLLLSTWQLSEAMVPVLIGVIIDRAVATGDFQSLWIWGGALVGLFAVLSYSYRFGARIGFGVVQREMHELRLEVAGRELDPRGVRSGLLPGETLSLATSDVELVGFTIRSLGYAVASAIAVVVSAVVLLRIDLVLGLVVLGGVPTVLIVIQVVTPAIARRSRDQQASIAHTVGVATDLVRGLRSIKGIGAEDVASERYRVESDRARAAGIRIANS